MRQIDKVCHIQWAMSAIIFNEALLNKKGGTTKVSVNPKLAKSSRREILAVFIDPESTNVTMFITSRCSVWIRRHPPANEDKDNPEDPSFPPRQHGGLPEPAVEPPGRPRPPAEERGLQRSRPDAGRDKFPGVWSHVESGPHLSLLFSSPLSLFCHRLWSVTGSSVKCDEGHYQKLVRSWNRVISEMFFIPQTDSK